MGTMNDRAQHKVMFRTFNWNEKSIKIMKTKLFSILAFSALIITAQAKERHHKEITDKVRTEMALKALKGKSGTVQVYAKGLVCESCALGIRKKLQRLDFVDTKKPSKGIVLDVRSQLVSISLKQGQQVDKAALVKAIKGAGYDPITLFKLSSSKKLLSEKLTN